MANGFYFLLPSLFPGQTSCTLHCNAFSVMQTLDFAFIFFFIIICCCIGFTLLNQLIYIRIIYQRKDNSDALILKLFNLSGLYVCECLSTNKISMCTYVLRLSNKLASITLKTSRTFFFFQYYLFNSEVQRHQMLFFTFIWLLRDNRKDSLQNIFQTYSWKNNGTKKNEYEQKNSIHSFMVQKTISM